MNKLLLALFLVLSACHPVWAQDPLIDDAPVPKENGSVDGVYWGQKPIQCGPFTSLIDMVKEYGEEPALSADGLAMGLDGRATPVTIVLGANVQTGTWTLVEVQKDSDQACVLGSGTGYKLHQQSTATKIPTRG